MQDEIFNHFKALMDEELDNSYDFRLFMWAPDNDDGHTFETADAYITTGATRAAVIDEHYDWIVKFTICEDGRNEDLCEIENDIYHDAMAEGIEMCFTRPVYLGRYEYSWVGPDIGYVQDRIYCHDEPVAEAVNEVREIYGETDNTIHAYLYAYPKAKLGSFDRKVSDVSLEKVKSDRSPLSDRFPKIAAMFLEEYGEDIYRRLTDLCVYDHVNDIHNGNIGFINNKIVLIDYAGYHDGCTESYYSEDNEEYERR